MKTAFNGFAFCLFFEKSESKSGYPVHGKIPRSRFHKLPTTTPAYRQGRWWFQSRMRKISSSGSPLQFFPAIRAVSTFGFLQKINRLDHDLLFPHGELFCFQIVFIVLDQFGFCHFKSPHCCAIAFAIPGKVFDRIFARSFVNNPRCFSPCFFE